MQIHKSRINNVLPYIRHIPNGSKIVFGIENPTRYSTKLLRIGFVEPFEVGQSLLPSSIGPVSNYNATGKVIVHKNMPMETAYRQVDWHWTEWHGPYRVDQSKIIDVPYKRYPRSFEAPPAIELTLTQSPDNQLLLTSLALEKTGQNDELLKHVINLFLEFFGECQFFTGNLETIIKTPVRRLNWTVLPQGEIPWEQIKSHYDPLVKRAPKGNQPILYYRLKTVSDLLPDFRAIGSAGFHGYIIHGFTEKKIFVLESMYYGNATYIFGDSWEELSKRTKAEILNEKLQKARIIHRTGWKKQLEQIMREPVTV